VHFAVGGGVALFEPRFADGAIWHDEPWHRVFRPIQAGNCGQGIFRRTRSASIRLRLAREALIGVEAGTQAVVRAFGHDLDFSEPGLPILEERSFVRRKTLQRSTGTRRATAHARVYWISYGLTQRIDACGQGHSHDSAEPIEWSSPEDRQHDYLR
jgi:hypothetical protein